MAGFAGVLPYAYDRENTLYLLLSREAYGRERGSWSGFAGGMLAKDGGDTVAAAAREAYEESSGLLGAPAVLRRLLTSAGHCCTVCAGVHYLLPIQYNQFLPYMFEGVRHALQAALFPGGACTDGSVQYSPMLEKDELRWFSEHDLVLNADGAREFAFRRGFAKDIPGVLKEIRNRAPATS